MSTLPDLYVVEKILGKRTKNSKVEYLVKWENYPHSDNTWEPLVNLESVMFLIDEYESNQNKIKKGKKISPKNNNCNLLNNTNCKTYIFIIYYIK